MSTSAPAKPQVAFPILHPDARRNLPGLSRRLPWVVSLVLLWAERAAQRRVLARLDPHELADIGVTRAAALAEAAKPFWQA